MIKKKPGRKAFPEEQRMIYLTVRMLTSQRAKFKLLGGAKWLRKKIDLAKLPREPKDD